MKSTNKMKHVLSFLLAICLGTIGTAQTITPVSVTATLESPPHVVDNLFDGNHNTRWGAEDRDAYATFDLGVPQNFDQFRIMYYNSDERKAFFDIEVSDDGSTWTTVALDMESSGTTSTTSFEDFDFPNQFVRYVRYHGKGNTVNRWNSIYELQIVNASNTGDMGGSIAVTGVSLNQSNITLNVGQTDQIIATVSPSNATDSSLTWSSSNTNVATVSNSGVVTAINEGSATITATANSNTSLSANATINVTASTPPPTGGSVWSESNAIASYNGQVGIGVATVQTNYKLAVNGTIRSKEIRVEQSNWPDYVFVDGYDLPTLKEIQKHIQEKGHLPNMPSAQEVATHGIKVGEMNRLLLEKIEELTLLLITQEQRIEKLEKEHINK